MTQQFKFGDHVKWRDDPRQFVYVKVDPHYDSNAGWIVSDDNAEYLASHTELELAPHHDTVRLDWLIKNGAHIENSYGSWAIDIAEDGEDGEDGEGVVENPTRIRASIDSIMQKESHGE